MLAATDGAVVETRIRSMRSERSNPLGLWRIDYALCHACIPHNIAWCDVGALGRGRRDRQQRGIDVGLVHGSLPLGHIYADLRGIRLNAAGAGVRCD